LDKTNLGLQINKGGLFAIAMIQTFESTTTWQDYTFDQSLFHTHLYISVATSSIEGAQISMLHFCY
jgi:hypothetical protein